MKVSRKWLQKYFEKPLPPAKVLAEALTFHAFEIESAEGDLLDVKVLPNRAADCLSHRGIAKELSAILGIPLKNDPLREPPPTFPKTNALTIKIEDPEKCSRYMGALVRGVKVGPSPVWLKEALEAVGQRSINNIVDATNHVMLNIGQPLHAFDAAKLVQKKGAYAIAIRNAKKGEQMTTLSGEECNLSSDMLLIIDANAGSVIGIAGVKGGERAEVTTATTDLIIESANFDGTSVRKTSQKLKLPTDASQRFQNRPSPELAAYGMRDVLALITEVAGGEIKGVVDVYPAKPEIKPVSVTLSRINGLLGTNLSREEVEEVFQRLGFNTRTEGDTFTVSPPFERTDLTIPEDLVEEVGRILGYERIPAAELPPIKGLPDQARFRGIERMKDQLIEQGFTEVSTQSFAKKGDIQLANPLDKNKPALRTSLEENLKDALTQAKYYAPRVLSPKAELKLFEVGTVFPKGGEHLELRMTERVPEWGDAASTVDNLSIAKLEDYGKDYVPKKYTLGAYKPFSIYPFIERDISMWTPNPVVQGSYDTLAVLAPIVKKYAPAPKFFTPIEFNSWDYYKDPQTGRTSETFRILFQSNDRTLTDEEVNDIMKKISADMTAEGYEVR